MADAPTLSPEVSRSDTALARTRVPAARGWLLYPPDHPAVQGALDAPDRPLVQRGIAAGAVGIDPPRYM